MRYCRCNGKLTWCFLPQIDYRKKEGEEALQFQSRQGSASILVVRQELMHNKEVFEMGHHYFSVYTLHKVVSCRYKSRNALNYTKNVRSYLNYPFITITKLFCKMTWKVSLHALPGCDCVMNNSLCVLFDLLIDSLKICDLLKIALFI